MASLALSRAEHAVDRMTALVADLPEYARVGGTCRRIVEEHGGLMAIDESATGGARVWFTLPA